MAIYHLHAQIIGRSAGQSACAASAYRSGTKIEDRTTGEIFNYTKKEKPAYSKMLLPEDSPEWANDRQEFWNRVEEKENRKNSQFSREFDIAIPAELGSKEIVRLVENFCTENFTKRGLVADYSIHYPSKKGDERNLHFHVMVPTRKLNKKENDGWGEKDREANGRDYLKSVRESWADFANKELELSGSKERIDHRTLEAQGVDREPQQHQGKAVTAMARRGEEVDRVKIPEPSIFQNEKTSTEDFKHTTDEEVREFYLKTAIGLLELSPEAWKEQKPKIDRQLLNSELLAMAMATNENLFLIEKANVKETENVQTELNRLTKIMPTSVEPKPTGLKKAFYNYTADDGKTYPYEKYAEVQNGILKEWEKKIVPLEAKDNELLNEQNLIDKIKYDKDYTPDNINALLQLGREQEKKRPSIFEKIKQKTNELLEKGLEFLQYRRIKTARDEVAEAREETARQSREAQNRNNSPTMSR